LYHLIVCQRTYNQTNHLFPLYMSLWCHLSFLLFHFGLVSGKVHYAMPKCFFKFKVTLSLSLWWVDQRRQGSSAQRFKVLYVLSVLCCQIVCCSSSVQFLFDLSGISSCSFGDSFPVSVDSSQLVSSPGSFANCVPLLPRAAIICTNLLTLHLLHSELA